MERPEAGHRLRQARIGLGKPTIYQKDLAIEETERRTRESVRYERAPGIAYRDASIRFAIGA